MLYNGTYPQRIGTLTRPSPDERHREADRWVALRTLTRDSVPAAAPNLTRAPAQTPEPVVHALFRAVDRRHTEARRKLGL